jgi:UDP-N-acetylmuramoyl-tripeptide--D-alanyl-D-alanine ligase
VVSRLITVGEKARIIAESAGLAGLSQESISWVPTVSEAIQLLHGTLQQKDIVLIKGSHGLHMDQIVNALEIDS